MTAARRSRAPRRAWTEERHDSDDQSLCDVSLHREATAGVEYTDRPSAKEQGSVGAQSVITCAVSSHMRRRAQRGVRARSMRSFRGVLGCR
jgi:hypothetical protein